MARFETEWDIPESLPGKDEFKSRWTNKLEALERNAQREAEFLERQRDFRESVYKEIGIDVSEFEDFAETAFEYYSKLNEGTDKLDNIEKTPEMQAFDEIGQSESQIAYGDGDIQEGFLYPQSYIAVASISPTSKKKPEYYIDLGNSVFTGIINALGDAGDSTHANLAIWFIYRFRSPFSRRHPLWLNVNPRAHGRYYLSSVPQLSSTPYTKVALYSSLNLYNVHWRPPSRRPYFIRQCTNCFTEYEFNQTTPLQDYYVVDPDKDIIEIMVGHEFECRARDTGTQALIDTNIAGVWIPPVHWRARRFPKRPPS